MCKELYKNKTDQDLRQEPSYVVKCVVDYERQLYALCSNPESSSVWYSSVSGVCTTDTVTSLHTCSISSINMTWFATQAAEHIHTTKTYRLASMCYLFYYYFFNRCFD